MTSEAWTCSACRLSLRFATSRYQHPRLNISRSYVTQSALRYQQPGGITDEDDRADVAVHDPKSRKRLSKIKYTPYSKGSTSKYGWGKVGLEYDALGVPAKVLMVPERNQRQVELPAMLDSKIDIPQSTQLSAGEILAGIAKERGMVSIEMVFTNLENIRRENKRANSEAPHYLQNSDYLRLRQLITRGFTVPQLRAYIQHMQSSPDSHSHDVLETSYSGDTFARTAWQINHGANGHKEFPPAIGQIDTFAIQTVDQNLEATAKKTDVVAYILEHIWRILPAKHQDLEGTMAMRLLPLHFRIITKHRSNILKRLSKNYDIRLEAIRSDNVVRFCSTLEAARDVYEQLKQLIGHVTQTQVIVPDMIMPFQDDSAYAAFLAEASNLTSTVIEEMQVDQSSAQRRFQITYLGPLKTDLEDGKRILLSMQRQYATRHRSYRFGNKFAAGSIKSTLIGEQVSLALESRHIAWSRLTSAICSEDPTTGASIDDCIGHDIDAYMSGKQAQPIISPGHGATSPYWSADPVTTNTVTIGKVLFPSYESSRDEFPNLLSIVKTPPTVTSELLTTIEGLLRPFEAIREHCSTSSTIEILLLPNCPVEWPLALKQSVPKLLLQVHSDEAQRTTSLNSARFILPDLQCNVLLPAQVADLSFLQQRFVHQLERPATGQETGISADSAARTEHIFDPAILTFIEASNLKVWSADRLSTPQSMKISVPTWLFVTNTPASELAETLQAHALSTPTAHSVPFQNHVHMEYVLPSISYHNTISTPYTPSSQLRYALIEAGRTGGRREALTLRQHAVLPDSINAPGFDALWADAHALLQSIMA